MSVRARMSNRLTRERLSLEIARAARPFLVLLVMLAFAAAATAMLLFRLGVPVPGENRHAFRVVVDDARGVTPGATEVRLSGVVVGEVTGVSRDGRRAVLNVELDGRYGPLRRDAVLRLRPKTPLEDMYLSVERRGTAAAGLLADGDALPAARTRTPVEIGEVLQAFDADVRTQMARAIEGLGRGLQDRGAQLRGALVELGPFLQAARRLSAEVAMRERHTRRLVRNLALLSAELGRRDTHLDRLVHRGAGALGELATVERQLGATIDALPPALARLPRSFRTVRASADALDGALQALRPTARALPGGLRAVERLAPELEAGAAALRRPLRPVRRLVRALPTMAADLEAAMEDLRRQSPRLDRVTAAVVPCKLAVQKFFHWTISVGKFYDVRGAALRGQPIVSTNAAGGLVPDLGLTSKPDCAAGGPRK